MSLAIRYVFDLNNLSVHSDAGIFTRQILQIYFHTPSHDSTHRLNKHVSVDKHRTISTSRACVAGSKVTTTMVTRCAGVS